MAKQLSFNEELTICNVSEMAEKLLEALQDGSDVVVDLAEVPRMDVAVLQVLLAAQKEAKVRGGSLVLTLPSYLKNYATAIGIQL